MVTVTNELHVFVTPLLGTRVDHVINIKLISKRVHVSEYFPSIDHTLLLIFKQTSAIEMCNQYKTNEAENEQGFTKLWHLNVYRMCLHMEH